MLQSTTPSLSQTNLQRWASRQFLTLPIVQTLLTVTFGYFLSSEAVVMRELRRWKRLWRRSLIRSHKRTSMGLWRSFWNGTTIAFSRRRLFRRELEFHVCTINKSARTKKVWKLIVCSSCIYIYIYIYVYILFLPPCKIRVVYSLCLILFTNPFARAGYDTRSIFKRSLTGLNWEFSFS